MVCLQNVVRLSVIVLALLALWGGHQSSDRAVEPSGLNAEHEEKISGPLGQQDYPVILMLDQSPVHEPEFRFWLDYFANYYMSSHQLDAISDWDAQQNGMPLDQFFLQVAQGYACKDRAIEALASVRGIELTEADQEEIAQQFEKNLNVYGSYAEYRRILDRMYGSEAMFNYLTRIDYLGEDLFSDLYGEKGERFSDQQVSDFVASQGLMSVRYLYVAFADDQAQRQLQQQALSKLAEQLQRSDSPAEAFEKAVYNFGQDEAMDESQKPLLLAPQEKGEQFGLDYQALAEGDVSSLVTANDGFYIIRRMPVQADRVVDDAGNTLRYQIAYQYRFKEDVEQRCAQMDVEYSDAFFQLDVAGLINR